MYIFMKYLVITILRVHDTFFLQFCKKNRIYSTRFFPLNIVLVRGRLWEVIYCIFLIYI